MWWRSGPSASLHTYFLAVCVLLCTTSLISAQDQAAATEPGERSPVGSDEIQAESVLLVPIIPRNAPRYTGLLLTKLVQENFTRTEVLTPTVTETPDLSAPVEEFPPVELDPDEITTRLTEIGRQQGNRYVAAGTITKRGAQYQIKMTVVDAESGRSVLTSEQTAVGLEDVDRAVMDITDEFIAAEFPAAVQKKVQEIRRAEAQEDAELREDLADLEKIAEEDPEEAIKRLPEKVQKAVTEKAKEQAKEEAREEVVQEEIQTLYEQEKEQKRIARARKIQKYSLVGLYSLRLATDFIDSMSTQRRMQSLYYWSAYLRDPYFYDIYRELNRSVNGFSMSSYIMGTLSSAGLGTAHLLYYPDLIQLSTTGRDIMLISQILYSAGAMSGFASGLIGIDSAVDFGEYFSLNNSTGSLSQSDFDNAYEKYNKSHSYYYWVKIGSLSLQTAGLIGTAAALFIPGETQPLFITERGKRFISAGNYLYGVASVARTIALNYMMRGAEERINADARGLPVSHTAADYYNDVALGSSITAFSCYTASVVFTVLGLLSQDNSPPASIEASNFKWGFIPYGKDGVSLSFNLRLR